MLKKRISLVSGIAIAISMVIGSGLFGLPGLAISATDPLNALLGWIFVVLLMPALIYVFSWLGSHYPSSEGISLYASMGLGAWSRPSIMMITCGTLIMGMPAFFLVGGSYIAVLLELDLAKWSVLCALLLAVATTLINLLGVEKLGVINKIVVILVLCIVAYISLRTLPSINLVLSDLTIERLSGISLPQLWLAMSIIFWAFQGWENMTFGFDEIENPKINIPLIYWFSFTIVSIIYIVFALAIYSSAEHGINVAGLSGVSSLLPQGFVGKSLLVVIVFVLVANANSWVFGSSRAFYSASQLGLLPSKLGVLNRKGIPIRMLIASLVIYSLVIILMWYFKTDQRYAFMLTTQGFIILYGGAVIAFLRKVTKWWQILIGLLAGISWIFLMQGFGWLILYPIGLMFIGLLIKLRFNHGAKLT